MTYYCKARWDARKDKLYEALKKVNVREIEYINLVAIVITNILHGPDKLDIEFDIRHITEIDDGEYQGTLLYLIPIDTYQPDEGEYIMTYVNYGSCSGCDILHGIKCDDDQERALNDLFYLCKDICMNMVRPYNKGWRASVEWNEVEDE